MTSDRLARQLRGLIPSRGGGEQSDGELLERYVRCRDATAFAALVGRHAPMVWGVCRRLAGGHHDAEDAFQATFLVLVGRADAVAPRDRVANWLYGVACRTALKARSRAARRRARERPAADLPEPVAPRAPDGSDLGPVLDRELGRLPARYREAILLCDIAGLTHAEAARRLRCPEGTLSARLSRGRARLAARLSRRGITPAAVGLGAGLLAGAAAGAPPARVVARTVDVAELVAAGGAVPVRVVALTNGGLKVMMLARWKVVLAGGALLAVLVGLAAADPPGPGVTRTSPSRPVPVPVPAAPREGLVLVTSFDAADAAETFKPDGTPARRLPVGELAHLWRPRYSPDGTRLAVAQLGAVAQGSGPWAPSHLRVLDPAGKGGPGEALLSDLRCLSFAWYPDGAKLYVSHLDPDQVKDAPEADKPAPVRTWVYDLKTGKKTPLGVPAGYGVVDVSPDGKTLLAVTMTLKDVYPVRTYLVPVTTLKPQPLTDKRFNGLRFSPDGKSVLGVRVEPKDRAPPELSLAVVVVADGSERAVELPAAAAGVYDACWSPDGRRVAFHWLKEVPPDPDTPPPVGDARAYAGRVTVADPDGSSPKTVLSSDGKRTVSGLDWK